MPNPGCIYTLHEHSKTRLETLKTGKKATKPDLTSNNQVSNSVDPLLRFVKWFTNIKLSSIHPPLYRYIYKKKFLKIEISKKLKKKKKHGYR